MLGVETGLYCALGLIANSTLVDVVIDSINVRKCVTVVSAAHEAIEGYIIHTLGRAQRCTRPWARIPARKKRVITTILNRRQCLLLRDFIKKDRPGGFPYHYEFVGDHWQGVPEFLRVKRPCGGGLRACAPMLFDPGGQRLLVTGKKKRRSNCKAGKGVGASCPRGCQPSCLQLPAATKKSSAGAAPAKQKPLQEHCARPSLKKKAPVPAQRPKKSAPEERIFSAFGRNFSPAQRKCWARSPFCGS